LRNGARSLVHLATDWRSQPGRRFFPGFCDQQQFITHARGRSRWCWLVIAAEPITRVDVSSADILAEVDETLRAAGITLCVTEMKVPGQGKLKRFGLYTLLGEARFFPR